ncbi:hypothetical protein GDO78_007489 [Eleutherodactylus coqui]|uniref:MORN repeat-containing protein 3 n=1 Tax=Eleutherodactylus coqui TaxID=57060 RepID=A0A8J6FHL0_ELECQ|nr:hypothetical protein GDO78_007489 [Eleutherodactylus coqui]
MKELGLREQVSVTRLSAATLVGSRCENSRSRIRHGRLQATYASEQILSPQQASSEANENRFEGSWKGGKKHGPGKFYYLNKGQMYDGLWVEDIPKCGSVVDFGRAEAPYPTKYPIAEVKLIDPEGVLEAARTAFLENDNS